MTIREQLKETKDAIRKAIDTLEWAKKQGRHSVSVYKYTCEDLLSMFKGHSAIIEGKKPGEPRRGLIVERLLNACKFAQSVLDAYDPPLDGEPYAKFETGMEELRQVIKDAGGG